MASGDPNGILSVQTAILHTLLILVPHAIMTPTTPRNSASSFYWAFSGMMRAPAWADVERSGQPRAQPCCGADLGKDAEGRSGRGRASSWRQRVGAG
jgi:hypothetical protein